jgi:hypothetical protein
MGWLLLPWHWRAPPNPSTWISYWVTSSPPGDESTSVTTRLNSTSITLVRSSPSCTAEQAHRAHLPLFKQWSQLHWCTDASRQLLSAPRLPVASHAHVGANPVAQGQDPAQWPIALLSAMATIFITWYHQTYHHLHSPESTRPATWVALITLPLQLHSHHRLRNTTDRFASRCLLSIANAQDHERINGSKQSLPCWHLASNMIVSKVLLRDEQQSSNWLVGFTVITLPNSGTSESHHYLVRNHQSSTAEWPRIVSKTLRIDNQVPALSPLAYIWEK